MKAIAIALKDLLLVSRDGTGLLLMLLAPLALTFVVALAFGGIGGGSSGTGLADIPVVIVNHDEGQLSPFLTGAFNSEELADLVEPVTMEDDAAARAAVDADRFAAAVIVPANFSASILPDSQNPTAERPQSVIEIYANPARPVGAGVIRSIVESILADMNTSIAGIQVTMTQLITSGQVAPEDAGTVGEALGPGIISDMQQTELISISSRVGGRERSGFDFLNYMAPSMAILYLTFTMTSAGRSILAERDAGTLPRMLITPSQRASVLGGKMLGVFLTGLLQMTVVLAAGGFLFNIAWGEPAAVILLTIALVAAASGWGVAIAAFARTPGQASATGMAVNLTFAALAGNFIARMNYPEWLQTLGLVTPNAWGIEGYWDLIYGGTLAEALPGILVLFAMAAVLFGAAIVAFRRQYV